MHHVWTAFFREGLGVLFVVFVGFHEAPVKYLRKSQANYCKGSKTRRTLAMRHLFLEVARVQHHGY